MSIGKYLSKKYQVYRKQTWSAPMLISVLIIMMMFLIFGFEQIGLLNKEVNLHSQMHQIASGKIFSC
jgi:tRNA C32,U32 (ribose-2'-O)-methylase TrmJ